MHKLSINPWLTMWFRPRQTIRAIINYNPKYFVIFLAILVGVSSVVDRAGSRLATLMFSVYNPILIIIIVLASGVITGVLSVYFLAFLLRTTGKLMGGRAASGNLRTAVVWSGIPVISVLPIDIFYAVLFPTLLSISESWGILSPITTFIGLGAGVWSLVLMVQSVSEVHGFQVWKSLLAIFLSSIAFAIVVLLVGIVIRSLTLRVFF